MASSHPVPLSLSLPLSHNAYGLGDFQPYFEGLLPEGDARRALAGELRLPEQDWLSLLAACGRDCIGDVVIRDDEDLEPFDAYGYEPITKDNLVRMFLDRPNRAFKNATMRLSLAGAQDKTGLAHQPEMPMDDEGAIQAAADGEMGPVMESTPYIADDLIEDIAPRRDVLSAFCR